MSFFKALKTVRTKMGFENQELEELKTCIRKVPILAQCLTTEGARVNSRPVATSSAYAPVATSSAYARVDDDCSREELHGVIKTLRETQDPRTDELFRCYSSMLNTAKIANLYTQIQTAEKKEFYKNICSILQELWLDEQYVITLLNKVSEAQNGLGYDHPETLKSLSNLANLFFMNNDYNRALPLFEECLAKRERVLGEDHPDTLKSLNNLAYLLKFVSKYDRALPLYEKLLAKQKRVLGPDHPETLITLNNFAYIFYRIENYDRALPLYEELLAKQKHVLGDEHPATRLTLKFLANIEERRQKEGTGASLGGKSKNKRNHKNKSFRSTRRRRYSRARGGKKIAASSSKTIKRRRKNAR